MEGETGDFGQQSARLIGSIYSGALNPSEYNRIFAAWDAYFALIEDEPARIEAEEFDWAAQFVVHFEQAGRILDRMQPEGAASAFADIDGMEAAAILADAQGRILRVNRLAAALLPDPVPARLADLDFDEVSARNLRNFLTATQAEREAEAGPCLLRLFRSDEAAPHFFCATWRAVNREGRDPSSPVLLQSVSAIWTPEVSRVFAAGFDLTKAEVDLLALLYQGLTIADIARARDRSQATLRSQLASIMEKTGARSQAALSRLVAGLVQMIRRRGAAIATTEAARVRAPETPVGQHVLSVQIGDGTTVDCVISGDPDGQPFYFIQTSTLPTLTPAIVAALRARGIRLISPMRPGESRVITAPEGAKRHLQVLDRLGIGSFVCGGHCSGGIHALHLARHAGARCRAVLLVDTGAPLTDALSIWAMPAAPRRMFLAARFFPSALATPIRLVAADFLSGPDGERRGVEYFYDGSPTDEAVVHEADHWQITRDNMAYCFTNVPQLVSDIVAWSQDTMPLLREVAATSRLHYLHGAENLMMRPDAIRRLAARQPGVSLRLIEDCAQLQMYQNPDAFADEITKLLALTSSDAFPT